MARPTVAEISLGALEHNIQSIMQRTGATPICAMVKADAYGHDALVVARCLANRGVKHWGVHSLEEALDLRMGGLQGEILVLGGTRREELAEMHAARLQPAVFDEENLRSLVERAKTLGWQGPLSVHLKLDTGMGRLGVRPENLANFLQQFKQQNVLALKGVFAHVPNSEREDFTRDQGKIYEACLAQIRAAGLNPGVRHHSNSLVSLLYDDLRYDLVRPGIILYGLYPTETMKSVIDVKPLMTFASRIISVRAVPTGTGVSYGHTFVTQRPSRLATIPVGYADGYPRLCSNRAQVLIRGRRYPIVGRVCMDMSVIDVTDGPEVQTGDRVVLFGSDGEAHIDVQEIADLAGTIAYEILCGISPRVPRVVVA